MTHEHFELPAAIAVIGLDGRVDDSTRIAQQHFGLRPGFRVADLGYEWLTALIQEAVRADQTRVGNLESAIVWRWIHSSKRAFRPMVVPLHTGSDRGAVSGVALFFKPIRLVRAGPGRPMPMADA